MTCNLSCLKSISRTYWSVPLNTSGTPGPSKSSQMQHASCIHSCQPRCSVLVDVHWVFGGCGWFCSMINQAIPMNGIPLPWIILKSRACAQSAAASISKGCCGTALGPGTSSAKCSRSLTVCLCASKRCTMLRQKGVMLNCISTIIYKHTVGNLSVLKDPVSRLTPVTC